jgi:hypothetical protein
LTSASCGWPAKTWPGEKTICPCGFVFPDRVAALFPHWHDKRRKVSAAEDFDAMEDDNDLDFG